MNEEIKLYNKECIEYINYKIIKRYGFFFRREYYPLNVININFDRVRNKIYNFKPYSDYYHSEEWKSDDIKPKSESRDWWLLIGGFKNKKQAIEYYKIRKNIKPFNKKNILNKNILLGWYDTYSYSIK